MPRDDEYRIERNADSIAIRFDVDYHGVAGFAYVAWPGADDEELRERLTGVSDVEVAGYFVAREVNRRLQMVNPVVLPFRGGLLRLVPQTLLAALYLRFAQGFAGGPGRPERPCDFEECRLPFTPERRDHRYHTKACKEAAGYRRRLATRDENDLAAALAPGDTSH